MWSETKDGIAAYYRNLVGIYGADPRSCDYGRALSQVKKFKVVSDVMDLSNKRILDVGCGLGDYAKYLKENIANVDYVGVDITSEMICKGLELYPGLDLREMDILNSKPEGQFDLVTSNGIFYLLQENAWEMMQELISRMYSLSENAVAFTALSTFATVHEDGEYYSDPLLTFTFCKSLTPWVTLRHDYLEHDFTVYMYKENPTDGLKEQG